MNGKIHLECLDWPETRTLIAAFARGDMTFKFVGGCVRDALLGQTTLDIDIATPALPDAVMKHLGAHGIRVYPTGIEHGTVTAVIGERKFEITTLRKDIATDGRHASVAFTDDWKEDAARRDFTLNALYVDASGNLTDYFGGEKDARAGIVRFIGDPAERIREDALRILRFFRFSARHGTGDADAQGLVACARSAALLEHLSGERIQAEMFKLLTADRASDMLSAMQATNILTFLIPAPVHPEKLPVLRSLESQFAQPRDAITALALLLRSAGDKASSAFTFIAARWKLSGAHKKLLQQLLAPVKIHLGEGEAKSCIRRLGAALFTQQVLLSAAEEHAAPQAPESLIRLAASWQIPVFPVSGNDLLARGFTSGAALGKALSALEDEWEKSGYVLSREALLGRL